MVVCKMEEEKCEYKIGWDLKNIIRSFIMLAIFGGITIWSNINYNAYNAGFIFGMILAILTFIIFLLNIYRAISTKVLITQNGFYCQTNPLNGRYKAGKTMKFPFNKSIYEHEIKVLKENIKAAKNQND